MSSERTRHIITDKLVSEQTGHSLEHWYALLDKKGAKDLSHAEIFQLVSEIPGLRKMSQWNQNLFTTSYEWSRNLKQRGERKDGFEISVSKTISAPVEKVYAAMMEPALRKRWLGDFKITIRKSTENKSARMTWHDDTWLSVDFYRVSAEKSKVVVQHQRITDFDQSEFLKSFWIQHLGNLKKQLEASVVITKFLY